VSRLGRYELGEEIARGGTGAVFRATDAQGRPCAIKLLHSQNPVHLRRFLRDRGWRARILVMDGSREHGDEGLARDLAEALDPAAADVVPYDPNPLQVYREIQRSRGLVGMRLHSVVFAFAAGVPYLAVAYHPKVAAFDATQAEGRCTLSRGDWTESGIVARLERCMDAAADAPLAATEGARAEIEGAFDWLMTTCGQAP